jgi:D-glycero-alpha-D-manno-heptose-7-phosphate kinase
MIISRTPLRISFFGGGTDYPDWYEKNGGSVISTTINKYNFINVRFLPPFFKYNNCIRYFVREETKKISDIKHPSVRETLKFLNFDNGIEVIHNADLPARGGLGSSSSFTVGFLNAMSALMGKISTKKELTNNAIHIEQNLIKESVGSQDQAAAAFGGLNRIFFGSRENVVVKPLILTNRNIDKLQEHMRLFFLGFPRNASTIAKHQISLISKKKSYLNEIYSIVDYAEKIISQKNINFKEFGKLLNTQWQLKKKLSNKISNNYIDNIYNEFLKHGALGGKLCGAGGGGFMLIFASKDKQKKILNKMKKILHVPFRFEFTGSQIVYYSK